MHAPVYVEEARPGCMLCRIPPHTRPHLNNPTHMHTLLPTHRTRRRSPFFTWCLPNGGGVHVAMSDQLYRCLVPLIDAVATSVEYMEGHIEKVRARALVGWLLGWLLRSRGTCIGMSNMSGLPACVAPRRSAQGML
jgi:hypothetical protein